MNRRAAPAATDALTLSYPASLLGWTSTTIAAHGLRPGMHHLPAPPGWAGILYCLPVGQPVTAATRDAAQQAVLRAWLTGDIHRAVGLRLVGDNDDPTSRVVTVRIAGTRSPCLILRAEPGLMVYGTLPGHLEHGEEAFALQALPASPPAAGLWQLAVIVTAVSRPARWPTRMLGPLGRWGQRWFTRRYARALAAVARTVLASAPEEQNTYE